jgi:hypothetical protein
MYPYAYYQSLMTWKAGADMVLHLGRFDLGAAASLAGGSVNEEDLMVSGTSGVQTSPFRLEDWYDRQMEYRTASRLNAGLSLRYNFRKGIYMEAEGSWLHGFDLRFMTGADRFGAAFRIGYDF